MCACANKTVARTAGMSLSSNSMVQPHVNADETQQPSHVHRVRSVIQPIDENACIQDIYDFRCVLGRGGFAAVNKLCHGKTFQTFAGKTMRKKFFDTTLAETTYRMIIEKLLNQDNDHIVKIVRSFEDNLNYYLVMHLCDCTLRSFMDVASKSGTLENARFRDFATQICLGVQFLHDHAILHRDIKPENIMVEDSAWRSKSPATDFDGAPIALKLIDFGLCTFFPQPDEEMADQICGTVCYMAPECLTYPATYSPQSDIFAIGCTMFFLSTGDPPCHMGPKRNLFERTCAWARSAVPEQCDQLPWSGLAVEALDVLRGSLAVNCRKRWESVESILQSAWLGTGFSSTNASTASTVSKHTRKSAFRELLMQEEFVAAY